MQVACLAKIWTLKLSRRKLHTGYSVSRGLRISWIKNMQSYAADSNGLDREMC